MGERLFDFDLGPALLDQHANDLRDSLQPDS